jgi:hypothetical protein
MFTQDFGCIRKRVELRTDGLLSIRGAGTSIFGEELDVSPLEEVRPDIN